MAKNKLRPLVINNNDFVWACHHAHLKIYDNSPCSEALTIYLKGNKRNFLRLYFTEDNEPDLAAGYPKAGVVWSTGDSTFKANLNRPGVIAAIINFSIPDIWNPSVSKNSVIIEKRMAWMIKNIEIPEERKP
ncbi:hypothetical protein MNBD_GAMMA10-3070 [hydrothermal vent metagenome]|uniref:Uncharacterized protein n=1 Tax=hydrothermal vent metagenome TaxID=652676 RepID=A0A3B0YMR4_9ZZZZ